MLQTQWQSVEQQSLYKTFLKHFEVQTYELWVSYWVIPFDFSIKDTFVLSNCLTSISFGIEVGAMARSIQLFESIRIYFGVLGIFPPNANENSSLNWRNLLVIFSFIQNGISSLVFFMFEANSVLDYGITFYTYTSMMYCVWYFVAFIWRTPQIFQLIESCQQFIEQRKCLRIKFWNW